MTRRRVRRLAFVTDNIAEMFKNATHFAYNDSSGGYRLVTYIIAEQCCASAAYAVMCHVVSVCPSVRLSRS